MNEEKHNQNDQAKELRNVVVTDDDKQNESRELKSDQEIDRDTDILNLPPRSEVHNIKGRPTRIKLSVPFRRLAFIILVLLAILIMAYFFLGDELFASFSEIFYGI
ncbi:hypothetical protein [Virgibacillus proomii]|uniref:hypothetical protein n=1 Tax=Virgibacillus proomii TaxID=84407 RepID=UPI001C120DD4|nr:hypothetical protein [Virgibacillus proomii]MBU5265389.1 hypothetical protein [Virgibacillus proomii]